MKHYWLICLFLIALINITGCYTQLAIQNDSAVEDQPTDPEPDPCFCDPFPPPPPDPDPIPIYDPPEQPIKERPYKIRNPQPERSRDSRDSEGIRNTGGRNNSGERGRR
jgi:hypothetical protein